MLQRMEAEICSSTRTTWVRVASRSLITALRSSSSSIVSTITARRFGSTPGLRASSTRTASSIGCKASLSHSTAMFWKPASVTRSKPPNHHGAAREGRVLHTTREGQMAEHEPCIGKTSNGFNPKS